MPAVLLSTDVRELLAEARERTLALVESVSDRDLDRVARVGPVGEPGAEFT